MELTAREQALYNAMHRSCYQNGMILVPPELYYEALAVMQKAGFGGNDGSTLREVGPQRDIPWSDAEEWAEAYDKGYTD